MFSEYCQTFCPCCRVSNSILLCPKFFKFRKRYIQFVDEIFINFSLIVHEKSLNIPDSKEEGFNDCINFYVLYLLLGWKCTILNLKVRSRGKEGVLLTTSFNHLWNSLLSGLHILSSMRNFFLLLYLFPIVISDFYNIINLYIIRPSTWVIINEWEELEAISSLKLIT